jgi:predicted transcriptional regulator
MGASLDLAQAAMEALQRGETPDPCFGVGFQNMAQMLAVFSVKRMDLVACIRAHGPLTLADLARRQGQPTRMHRTRCRRFGGMDGCRAG